MAHYLAPVHDPGYSCTQPSTFFHSFRPFGVYNELMCWKRAILHINERSCCWPQWTAIHPGWSVHSNPPLIRLSCTRVRLPDPVTFERTEVRCALEMVWPRTISTAHHILGIEKLLSSCEISFKYSKPNH